MFLLKQFLLSFILSVALLSQLVISDCPNGCSHRGLCINNACVCAEGLTGSDCSRNAQSNIPTLYECPTCYQMTIGSARYISGPSHRLPDGPIVGLNYKGTLSVYQGNGNGEMISSGTSCEDFLPSPIEALKPGDQGQFDSCGSWIMRALTADSGKVIGFYHAETACDYSKNHQTRKSAGYAVSLDGGKSFTKPAYPNNKLTDTRTPILIGQPSGEGDISVVMRGDYYYMFFGNAEDWHMGVARASRAGEAYPGSFYKYFNGNWNQPALGGNSSRLQNFAGTQVYLHTPSQSFVSVGNANPYWNHGFMLSVSDNAVDWKYFADPIFTPDPVTNGDEVMYPSFLGPSGGYDIGSNFQFYYMWIPPWAEGWATRYQIAKDVTLTYVGRNSTVPLAKIALTSYRSKDNQETWQSTELCIDPYNPVGVVGYLMSRPYPYTFVVYDCFNSATGDHFVGTADECFSSGSSISVIRTLGYMWSNRVAKSVAVYRCTAGRDIFLSPNPDCDGLAPAQTIPFGFVMDGPALQLKQEILIPQGATWKYSPTLPSTGWTQRNFSDSAWPLGVAPFGNKYVNSVTYFGRSSYYFRYNFDVPAGKKVKSLFLSVASEDFSTVYLNGAQVDNDTVTWHEASSWNRRVYISTETLVVGGSNVLAVKTQNYNEWAFFDCMLIINYDTIGVSKRSVAEEIESAQEDFSKTPRQVPKFDRSHETRATTTILPKGSDWKYLKTGVPPITWTQLDFEDSQWNTSAAPFVTGYSDYAGKGTPFGNNDYYFRSEFYLPEEEALPTLQVSVASDNYAIVYVNGYLVDSDPSPWHSAKYWNREFTVAASMLNNGDNIIAVVTKNMDQWAFFDLQIDAIEIDTPVVTGPSPILIPQGSTWLYYNKGVPPTSWTQQTFNASAWSSAPAPFVTGYSAYSSGFTPFGPSDHYFRSKFTIAAGATVKSITVSVASDNYAIVYINGVPVEQDPSSWHSAIYWNRQVSIDTSMLVTGSNTIAVITKNADQWAFFDLQLSATYDSSPAIGGDGSVICGVNGQVIGGRCMCDSGWGGLDCTTHLCSYTDTITEDVIPAGSSWRTKEWNLMQAVERAGWFGAKYDDSTWAKQTAPFGTYQYAGVATVINKTPRLYRKKFTVGVPWGMIIQNATLSVASEDIQRVWVNGKFIDKPIFPYLPNTSGKRWNTVMTIDGSLLSSSSSNVIAVEVPLVDGRWTSYFDLQLTTSYSVKTCTQN